MEKVFNLVILDASGSMSIIRKAAHKGLNDTIKQLKSIQKEMPDRQQLLTVILFNSDDTEFLYDNTPIQEVGSLPYGAYKPTGCTPLYDAIGQGIEHVRKIKGRNDSAMVTIITDGEENSWKHFNHHRIQYLIDERQQKGWDFTFIGTEGLDVDRISTSIGITQTIVFEQNDAGTATMFEKRHRQIRDYNERLSRR